MNQREKNIRQILKSDFVHYAQKCLKVRNKDGNIVPFSLNRAQLYAHEIIEKQKRETGKVRALALKGRQQGFSTYVGGRYYHAVSHRSGVKAFILTHEAEATDNLFEMTHRYHENCPAIVRPETGSSSAKELFFTGLDSGYKVGTAGNKGAGRSSTIQFFHGSEVAMWPNAHEHSQGVIQAVPNSNGTEIILESTARGIGNYFHTQWQLAESGESDYIPIFLPWFWQDEYRRSIPSDFNVTEEEAELVRIYKLDASQLMFRRYKIQELSTSGVDGSLGFMQEYPNNSIEAFQTSGDDTLISPLLVMRARKTTCEGHGALIVGVDPARFGDDRTSIVYRRGREAFKLMSYKKKSTMEVAGIVHNIIIDDHPDRVFIDIGGLGAGVYDRLVELGHGKIVKDVNFGSSPLNAKLYCNKRAEMWGLCKKWLEEEPISIPDSDTLHADLTATKYTVDSLGRLVIEKKEAMKKRGLRSPDEADSLCLTFAEPFDLLKNSRNSTESTARRIMSHHNKRLRS